LDQMEKNIKRLCMRIRSMIRDGKA
jgi:hypothetical protein